MNEAVQQVAVSEPDEAVETGESYETELAENSEAALVAQARPLRSINEIIADLSKPIKPRHIRQKVRGGQTLEFIPWYHAVKYLDLYAPGWSYEVRTVTWFESRLILTVRLSIPCLEGVIYREATGTEEEPEEGEKMYGDPSSNAESMALRRAAAKFGLGLYLYHKDKNMPQRRR
jgi:hypothetical protein